MKKQGKNTTSWHWHIPNSHKTFCQFCAIGFFDTEMKLRKHNLLVGELAVVATAVAVRPTPLLHLGLMNLACSWWFFKITVLLIHLRKQNLKQKALFIPAQHHTSWCGSPTDSAKQSHNCAKWRRNKEWVELGISQPHYFMEFSTLYQYI